MERQMTISARSISVQSERHARRQDDEMVSTDNRDQGIEPGDERNKVEMVTNRPTPDTAREFEARPRIRFVTARAEIGHGSVLIAAITSCTNTSNPSVMLAAGLLAKKAVERGLRVDPAVKTSLAPGSRVVSDYLTKTGLQPYLDQLGSTSSATVARPASAIPARSIRRSRKRFTNYDLVAASVLSGNRNFEARVHQNIKANFLMSPPLVVAFALAGRVDLDLTKEPIGKDKDGKETFPARSLADVEGSARRHAVRAHAGSFSQTLSRFRRSESEVERNPVQHRRHL